MKVLVIGNSFVVTLRESWPAIAADQPDMELSYFVAPNRIYAQLELDDSGRFGLPDGARTSRDWLERLNGDLTARPADYDVIVAVGMHYGIGAMLRLATQYQVDGLRTACEGGRRMSREAFFALHDDVIAQDLDRLSGFPAERTIVVPGNRAAEGVGGDDHPGNEIWAVIDATGANLGETISLLYSRVADAIAARGMTAILQPAETLAESGLSRAEFAGGNRLDAGRPDKTPPRRDYAHLTAAYGAHLWVPILAEIAERGATASD